MATYSIEECQHCPPGYYLTKGSLECKMTAWLIAVIVVLSLLAAGVVVGVIACVMKK